ncbi:MAG: reverse transcriptase family protein, partial [Pseudomonadota bacterium]
DVTNYRPISVTSCCSRVLERIVRFKLASYLQEHHILLDTQHGFQAGKSTDSALVHFYDYVTRERDLNKVVEAVFFDFSKAFDRIPHHLLIQRLKAVGISGVLLKWFTNFLKDRLQKVRIGGSSSQLLRVTSGVIQGSVLGPTLFNIYINGIDYSVKYCHLIKYADDLRIFLSSKKDYVSFSELRRNIQHDIDSIVAWAEESCMSLNASKCFQVTFGHVLELTALPYSISGNSLPHKNDTSFKDLGLTVTSSKLFKNHIDSVVSKAYQRLGLINKIFTNKSQSCLLKLYKAFVRPIVEYSSVTWNPHTVGSIDKIERVQKRMTKMIPNLRALTYRDRLKVLNLLSLQARRLRSQLLYVFKMRCDSSGINLTDLFTYAKIENRPTRGHAAKISLKNARNNYRLHFFTVSIIDAWNKLPESAVSASSVAHFKKELSSYFNKENIW